MAGRGIVFIIVVDEQSLASVALPPLGCSANCHVGAAEGYERRERFSPHRIGVGAWELGIVIFRLQGS